MTVDEAIICLSDMKIKIAIPKAAVQAKLNNDALDMAIEALNCSEIPNNWIPCSERSPEERGLYLTTTKNKEVYCDYWNEDNFDRTEMVIAWMPLPEPYQEGGTE